MSIHVTLNFYKPTGKWYSESHLELDCKHFYEAMNIIREKDRAGELGFDDMHMVATTDNRHGGLSRLFTADARMETT
jgi:hypothetical protein